MPRSWVGLQADAPPAPAARCRDIAARWGVWHLGHFVTDDERMFGELPSGTPLGRRASGAGLSR